MRAKNVLSVLVTVAALAGARPLFAQASDTSYTIVRGTYSGTIVPVHRDAALRRGSRFWRVAPRANGRLVGWNPSRFPIAVALRAGHEISAGDSAAFWGILRGMEQDVGLRLFQPSTLGPGQDPDDVIVIDVRAMTSDEGVTLVTWTNSGSLYDARVFLRSRDKLHDPSVIQHEMMHALGFGHTSSWVSIMNARPGRDRLSAEDVAYVQVALESRAESERIDMWDRLALAVDREGRTHPVVDGLETYDSGSAQRNFPLDVRGARCGAPLKNNFLAGTMC